MSGGTRAGAGRKIVEINLLEVEKLYSMNCTDQDVADWFGISLRTIKSRRKQPEFATAMRRGKVRARISIRTSQMKLLEKGNPAMAIWMGKVVLGQRETSTLRTAMPTIKTIQDVGHAATKLMQDVSRGKTSLSDAERLMVLYEKTANINERGVLEVRVGKLEEDKLGAPVSGPQIIGLPNDIRQ